MLLLGSSSVVWLLAFRGQNPKPKAKSSQTHPGSPYTSRCLHRLAPVDTCRRYGRENKRTWSRVANGSCADRAGRVLGVSVGFVLPAARWSRFEVVRTATPVGPQRKEGLAAPSQRRKRCVRAPRHVVSDAIPSGVPSHPGLDSPQIRGVPYRSTCSVAFWTAPLDMRVPPCAPILPP
jgi:hypothetical protein